MRVAPTPRFAFHLLSLTKNFIFSHDVEKERGSGRRVLLYDDVAIYSDSMIYSNLRCFYRIKFIFCTMSRVVECEFPVQISSDVKLSLSPFLASPYSASKRILSPFCDKCEYL